MTGNTKTGKREFGIIGLGRIGGGLALHALDKGMKVVGFDIHGIPEGITKAGIKPAETIAALCSHLAPQRIVFLYIPAGPAVDKVLDELGGCIEAGDIIIDGGNSYWGDSIRRHERLGEKGLWFIDLGTSGGIRGAREGACLTAGGDREAVEYVEPILLELSFPGGYVYAGPTGAGHFTKLVHNGIEFGMLQSIGEGVSLLKQYRDRLDIAEILNCWSHGSVIRSWLIELMEEALRNESKLEDIPDFVEDTGEVNWLVTDALNMEVPIPVISQSVMELISYRDKKKTAARAIAMMRHAFGGHPYGPEPLVRAERHEGKVGDFYKD